MNFKITKVRDAVYEIPAEGDMTVPVRLYADEKMLEKIKTDRTLQQAANATTLPGLQDAFYVMPDGHEGYGFPIGGVAAFDAKEGVVSPGAVGYDINCTDGETRVLLEHGVNLSIKELEERFTKNNAQFVDFNGLSLNNTKIMHFMKRLETSEIYQITTQSGRCLRVTGDHPVRCKDGMKKASEMKLSDQVVVYSFSGVKYLPPSEEILVNEEHIQKVMLAKRTSINGNALPQVLKILKKRELLPLKSSSDKLPYLTKIIGYIFGDGSISFVNKRKGVIWFYGKEEDLEKIRIDIKKIGFTPSKVYKRLRTHQISTHYKDYTFSRVECSFKISSTALATLLVALGTPSGNKTTQEYLVPNWLFKTPLWLKRLFLAAFFGAELSTPKTLNKYNFYAPTLGMNKLKTLENNAVEFLTQLKKILEDFEIKTSPVMVVEGYSVAGKKGKTCGYRIQLSSTPENLMRFFENISFEYHKEKFKNACLAANYLRLKNKITEKREKIRNTAINLYARGLPAGEIYNTLSSKYVAVQFVKHSIWTEFKGKPRIAFNFASFSEYKDEFGFGDYGLALDEIDYIEKIPFNDLVYDISISNENHNFIADNIVVSNCGVRLLTTNLFLKDVKPKIKELVDAFFKNVPAGVGSKSTIRVSDNEMREAVESGVDWSIKQGYATKKDKEHTEEKGRMKDADFSKVSEMAKKRGAPQFGSLGSGNHFLELQKVTEIYDSETAKKFGITDLNQITLMIHSGSRGFGHQICSDYLRVMLDAARRDGIMLKDPELACAYLHTQEARDYLGAMNCGVNFAFNNRQIMTFFARNTLAKVMQQDWESMQVNLLYDVCHNIAKFEEHKGKKVCVHRKGATRAYWKGMKDLPGAFSSIGQPVLIPGSMNTSSFVLVGQPGAEETFGSCCHGAGRVMSRAQAIRSFDSDKLQKEMIANEIYVRATKPRILSEEAGGAYKKVDEVVDCVRRAGLANLVAKIEPIGVIKG
ncbi:MAG: RtcB family protein [Candidatus Micrarchaeota archaeon]